MGRWRRLLELFGVFFKIGLFTFGGGYAMISLIGHEIGERRRWIGQEELTEVFAIAESTPGPIAVNCATYVGCRREGVAGSVWATLGVVGRFFKNGGVYFWRRVRHVFADGAGDRGARAWDGPGGA